MGEGSRRMAQSTEKQYFDKVDGAAAAVRRIAAAHAW